MSGPDDGAETVVETVVDAVRRLLAPNPGPMTGPGTNAYLVGRRRLALIDPGPDDPAWIAALLGAASGPDAIAAILVTHAHRDHTAAARTIAARSGAPIYGFGPAGAGRSDSMARFAAIAPPDALGGGEGIDPAHRPDRLLADGAAVAPADPSEDWRLRAIHTPGHTSDHLCFALERAHGGARAQSDEANGDDGAGDDGAGAATGVVFTGDHVMAWSTSLVSPPDGDMGAYLASLERLRARRDGPTPDRLYLPGHGPAIEDPAARLDALIAHRRGREAQILDALDAGPASAEALARRVYADLDPGLLGMAARNVLAHLVDLTDRGVVEIGDDAAGALIFKTRRK